ncbi:DNA helicase RecQ [Pararhodospirillum oryzae]|uniref:DNA helicase RecQ n=1 Tax=Pararhodospirillum oryzae TaxID=478448 RepID=A0A512H5J4_9PROT|nr:DNA helicase RecQ [Pararhodospirillum oryzae]GEO80684.1 ATP-dependent DNA helicase RecQ [Pararhodospirillum oryzae]
MSSPLASDALALLHRVFGFKTFRPGQQAIIDAILAGRDVLAIMPTGAGKSLCYQLPALMRPGVTLVVSPLIALMRDQVAQLRALGVEAGSLNSTTSPEEYQHLRDVLRAGEPLLLYVAPERLARPGTLEYLARHPIKALVIDEAHCVSQWGHDFRPEYLTLGQVRQALGNIQTLAFTATADTATRADIEQRLFPEPPERFVGGFDRPNLFLAMRPKTDTRRQILAFVKAHKGDSGIIYCASRAGTEALADALSVSGVRALPYHAGLDKAVREANQDAFVAEDGLVMVATIAFGMGIDKPDVRFVCHANMPRSIEAYYQEIGRAGRDGLPADTLTFYGLDDMRLYRSRIEEGAADDDRKRLDIQRLNALFALCEAPRCRRQTLLAYFGETIEPCGHCDICQHGVVTTDATVEARKVMSAMLRTGQRFATEHLVNILMGTETDAVREWNHHHLPTFGVGRDHARPVWRALFRQMYAAGLIEPDFLAHGRWTMTPRGNAVLRQGEPFLVRADVLDAASGTPGRRPPATAAPRPALADKDRALFEALRVVRRTLAETESVPPYVIFPDRTLIEMASRRPRRLADLEGIHGIGARKLARYGAAFLAVLEQAPAES